MTDIVPTNSDGTPATPSAPLTQSTGCIKKVDAKEAQSITRLPNALTEGNWAVWKEQMLRIFKVCGVRAYIEGTLLRPNEATHRDDFDAWEFNDGYAQLLITINLSSSQMLYVTQLPTARTMWQALAAIHEVRGHQTAMAIQRQLFRAEAHDGDNISEHLTRLKEYWERLNMIRNEHFQLSDVAFKNIIASSLPQSWDAFTEPYVGGYSSQDTTLSSIANRRSEVKSQEFIGILKEEYNCRQTRLQPNGLNTDQTLYSGPTRTRVASGFSSAPTTPSCPQHPFSERISPQTPSYPRLTFAERISPSHSRPFSERIGQRAGAPYPAPNFRHAPYCRNCGLSSHCTDNCRFLGQPKCMKCGFFGHISMNCRKETGRRSTIAPSSSMNTSNQQNRLQVNVASEEHEPDGLRDPQEDEPMEEEDYDGEYYNMDEFDDVNNAVDERLCFYDWLADSGTTSHVTNQRDAFVSFKSITLTTVRGVGNIKVQAAGQGTVELKTKIDGQTYVLQLDNVLYIPTN